MARLMLALLGGALLMLSGAPDAQAVVCARGVARAGCAGPNGAVVARRPPARAVVVAPRHPYHRRCQWRGNRRVCW
jgi:hypothetical protein